MLKKDGDKKFVNTMVDKDDYEVLKRKAKEECRSVSSLCRIIINKYIEENRNGDK